MKKIYLLLAVATVFLLSVGCQSSYKWQRQKYYQKDPRKNWNYQKNDRLPNK